MRETWVRSLGREDPLEKEMATHSSILAWKIPWTEEPAGLQSMGSQRIGHDWATSPFHIYTHTHTQAICLTLYAKELWPYPWGQAENVLLLSYVLICTFFFCLTCELKICQLFCNMTLEMFSLFPCVLTFWQGVRGSSGTEIDGFTIKKPSIASLHSVSPPGTGPAASGSSSKWHSPHTPWLGGHCLTGFQVLALGWK